MRVVQYVVLEANLVLRFMFQGDIVIQIFGWIHPGLGK